VSDPSDQDLIEQLLAGEPSTWELVRSWIRDAFIPYRQRLAVDREDMEQEILLQLIEALRRDGFEGRSQFKTYVKSWVHHKSIDRLRARSRREWVVIDDLDLPSEKTSALEELASAENVQIALRVLEEMPEDCRELWRLIWTGMGYKEMSRRLGISEGTLRARVLRCRRRALEARRRRYPESGESGG